jgi:hypothetical protein
MGLFRQLIVLAVFAVLGPMLAVACSEGGDSDEDAGDNGEAVATQPSEAGDETREPGATISPSDVNLSGTIEGVFVAPDSHSFTQTFSIAGLSGTEEAVVIGDTVWFRSEGDEEWRRSTRSDPEASELIDLTSADPDFLFDQEFSQDLATLEGEPEELNGVQTTRYDIPREAVAALADLFGQGFLGETSGIEEFEMTVWLEEETGALVRAEFTATGSEALFAGAPFELDPGAQAQITMTINLTEINDPNLSVQPPVAGDPGLEGDAGSQFNSFRYTVEIDLQVLEP